ncbi:MAG TPA: FtsX-like permease family protein [candidate division WWE3 bacterium]|uniref:Cell division protein FtsX n=1 Tax=candidate division WWE3 bacterium TaxID=2053526 RepID=A0A7V5J0C1_UNCKA|nr:FtsX-like permease family protein [candidate division WWE3 bacterium]
MIRSFGIAKKNLGLQSITTFVSLIINTQTFFVLSFFIAFAFLSAHLLNYLESKAQLTVYFQDTVKEDQILDLKNQIASMPEVSDVRYISKTEALAIFLKTYESEPLLTESVDAGVFPASLDIQVYDINDLDKIADFLKKQEGIEEISYFEEALRAFKSLSNGIKYVGLALVSVMLFSSFLIILVLTGITIRDSSEEIKILRLMGATNSYIQGPFFAQTFLISLLSSLFATVLFLGIIPFVEPLVRSKFAGVPIPSVNFLLVLYLFLAEFAINLFISMLGTWVAIKKYLRF